MTSRSCFWLAAWLFATGEVLGMAVFLVEEPIIGPWQPASQRVFGSLFLAVYGILCPTMGILLLWASAKKGISGFLLGLASASTIILSALCTLIVALAVGHGQLFEPLMLAPLIVFILSLAASYGHTEKTVAPPLAA